MGGTANTVKVGFFAILGALLLIVAVNSVRDGNLFAMFSGGTSYIVSVRFTGDTIGLQKGMPVKLKGTDVGFLTTTSFSDVNQDVIAELRIDDDEKIYREATLEIREEGLLGERFLAFKYPAQLPAAPLWAEEGHEFVGNTATGLSTLISTANEVLVTLHSLIGDEELRSSITAISDGITDSLGRANVIMENMNEIMMENQDYIGESLVNVEAMSDNFLLLSQNLQEASVAVRDLSTDPKNVEQLHTIMANIEATTKNIDSMSAQVNSLLSDPMVQADIKDSIRLLPQVLQETKDTMSGAQESLEQFNLLLENADGLVDTTSWAIEDVSGSISGLSGAAASIETRGSVNVRGIDSNTSDSFSGDDSYVGDANMAVGVGGNYVQVGMDNIGDGDDFNLMLGVGELRGFSFRGGVYRSELGLGASWWDTKGAGAELTWFDLNNPQLNGYGYLPIGDSVNVVIGVDDITDKAVPSLGLGLKF